MNNFLRISKNLLSDPSQGICSTLINPKYISHVFSTGPSNVTVQLNSVTSGSDTLTFTVAAAGTAQRDELLSAIIDTSSAVTSSASSVYTLASLSNSATISYGLA
jgi:hypothetical protein